MVLAGEITTNARVNFDAVARKTIQRIGYTDPKIGFDTDGCTVIVAYGEQSRDIAQGVDEGKGLDLDQGAGDQGLMFGYACDETPEPDADADLSLASPGRAPGRGAPRRPPAVAAAGREVAGHHALRRNGKPDSIDTVVLSTQHAPGLTHKQIEEAVIEQIIKPVLPKNLVKGKVKYLVNPTGAFEIGGPKGDCGLTGRKIIVDTYGGSAPHGGGAFSGKDPSKVDRSAAYAARYVAKNIVAAGLASQVPGAGVLRHRRGAADQRDGDDAGHRQDLRRQARAARAGELRPAPEGHHPDARPAAPDLREDRRLRPLRPRRARVHLGSDRQGAGAEGSRLKLQVQNFLYRGRVLSHERFDAGRFAVLQSLHDGVMLPVRVVQHR